jgi:hypothetical protein
MTKHVLIVFALAASLLLSGCVKKVDPLPDPHITITSLTMPPVPTGPTVIVPNP